MQSSNTRQRKGKAGTNRLAPERVPEESEPCGRGKRLKKKKKKLQASLITAHQIKNQWRFACCVRRGEISKEREGRKS